MPNIPAELIGREQIRAGGERLQAQWEFFVQTTHPGTIQLDGDTATGRAYIQELARARDGRQGLNYAIYHDRYQRTGDGWKFTERVYEVRYLDTTPLAGSAPPAAGAPADPPAGNTSAAEGAFRLSVPHLPSRATPSFTLHCGDAVRRVLRTWRRCARSLRVPPRTGHAGPCPALRPPAPPLGPVALRKAPSRRR